MTKALGYMGKKKETNKFKPRWNTRKKKKERDPDAMDVDFTHMSKEKKERLMKSGSCFRCEQQGHLSKDCPKRQAMIREATTEEAGWTKVQSKKKQKASANETPPPAYDSILKQINACSMED